jgi:hypothetical protein
VTGDLHSTAARHLIASSHTSLRGGDAAVVIPAACVVEPASKFGMKKSSTIH